MDRSLSNLLEFWELQNRAHGSCFFCLFAVNTAYPYNAQTKCLSCFVAFYRINSLCDHPNFITMRIAARMHHDSCSYVCMDQVPLEARCQAAWAHYSDLEDRQQELTQSVQLLVFSDGPDDGDDDEVVPCFACRGEAVFCRFCISEVGIALNHLLMIM